MTVAPARAVGWWLASWAGVLFLLIVIGGATRLTESGLSITEWRPVSGVLPPLSDAAWNEEFSRYQQIPQYQELNRGMTLGEFKRIYFWEYLHRLWARIAGITFLIPFLFFVMTRRVDAALRRRLVVLLFLLAFQGALGWFMVRSGLSGRTSVSQYRLAAHLGSALVIFGATVWHAATCFAPFRRNGAHETLVGPARLAVIMVSVTAVAGAFVAGLDAGRAYNTFPLMGGRVIPEGYARMDPWVRNLFENIPAVQFNHRLLAMATVLVIAFTWWRARGAGVPAVARRRASWMLAFVAAQFVLGIVTLVHAVPVTLGVSHQGVAVLLLTAALLVLHATRYRRDEPAA